MILNMKRSEINRIITDAKNLFKKHCWELPPFAYYSPKQWLKILKDPASKKKHSQILEQGLGWDITDFGSEHFIKLGLFLFTIRNGSLNSCRDYAEKIMIVQEEQITPWHFHWDKAEDIINRGGGNLVVEVYNASQTDILKPGEPWCQGTFDEKSSVQYFHDGLSDEVQAGGKILLKPGESIQLLPRMYHKFYGEKNKGTVLVGEVSKVNDDARDNRFYDKLARFKPIEEDEMPIHFLGQDYPNIENIMKKYP